MSTRTSLSRRGFVAMNAAGAAMLTLPRAGMAAPVIDAAPPVGTFDWRSSGAAELAAHIGRRFRFRGDDGRGAVMRLVAVEAVESGPDRPAALPRPEGVIAVFDGPDTAPLAQAGHRVYRVSAPGIGHADVLAGPVRRRDGTDVIEIVLN